MSCMSKKLILYNTDKEKGTIKLENVPTKKKFSDQRTVRIFFEVLMTCLMYHTVY